MFTVYEQQFPRAVALDCEMGMSREGESELIRITAVDFFSGHILVDNLVFPSVPMHHYNTKYSGVSRGAMNSAVKARSCIFGRDAARAELWEHIGPDTIVVVHGGQNDLVSLQWIHGNVIDTFILESYTGIKAAGGHSLKNLCKTRLGVSIQDKGRLGHCSLEDAMACRELLHHWAMQIPDA